MRQVNITSIPLLDRLAINPGDTDLAIKTYRALSNDLKTLTALYNIGRDDTGGFVVGDVNSKENPDLLSVTKDGVLHVGSNYGAKPNLVGNALGSFYAVPQWARYYQAGAVAAGNGSYVWDTEAFNNAGDLYTRTTGNTRIQILVPGDYWVYSSVLVDLAGLVAGNNVTVDLLVNAGIIKTFGYQMVGATPFTLASFVVAAMIQTTVYTDYVEVALTSTGGVADRLQGIALTTLDICKVN